MERPSVHHTPVLLSLRFCELQGPECMAVLAGQLCRFVLPVFRNTPFTQILFLRIGIALLRSATNVASRIWPKIGR